MEEPCKYLWYPFFSKENMTEEKKKISFETFVQQAYTFAIKHPLVQPKMAEYPIIETLMKCSTGQKLAFLQDYLPLNMDLVQARNHCLECLGIPWEKMNAMDQKKIDGFFKVFYWYAHPSGS